MPKRSIEQIVADQDSLYERIMAYYEQQYPSSLTAKRPPTEKSLLDKGSLDAEKAITHPGSQRLMEETVDLSFIEPPRDNTPA